MMVLQFFQGKMYCWLLHTLMMKQCNADGIGNIRKEELYLASTVFKVPTRKVKVVDHPNLQDGFGNIWNCILLERIIKEEIHSNAIDLNEGKNDYYEIFLAEEIGFSSLKTAFAKFFTASRSPGNLFWKLFVSLSSYTYVNTLKMINK